MPEKSGLPSAVRGTAVDAVDFGGLCAETTVASATNSNTTVRFITFLPFLPFLPALPSPLLTKSFHRRKHAAAVRERHCIAGAVRRSILRTESLYDDLVARLHRRAADAPALQYAGRRAGESPVRDGPVRVFHVHVEPDVRIGPLDSGDRPCHFQRLLEVVLCNR